MARVIWSRRALRELADITDYLLARDEVAARRIAGNLTALGNSLSEFPRRGRPAGRYRELAVVPPFVLRYAVKGDIVRILRLRHGRQRPLA